MFTIDATPHGAHTCVLLDGEDISDLLRGIEVSSSVDGATTVKLVPARGKRAQITARLPEAQIVIADEP